MSDPKSKLPEVDDYTSGAAIDEDALEAELFQAAAEGTAGDLVFLDHLARIAPWFAARGGFDGGITRDEVARLRAQPNVHYFEVEPGRVTEIEAWPEQTELVTYRVAVDLRGYDDVTVHVTTPAGEPVWTFRDCQYDPSDGNLYSVCDEPLARASFWRKAHVIGRIEAAKDGRRTTVATVEVRPAP